MRAGSWWSRKLLWERVSGASVPMGCTLEGLNPGTHRGPAAPTAAGHAGRHFTLSPKLTAPYRARKRSWERRAGMQQGASLIVGHGCSVDAHQGQRNQAAAGCHRGFPDVSQPDCPQPCAAGRAHSPCPHSSLGRGTSSRPPCSSSCSRYFTHCFAPSHLISLHRGTLFSPQHQAGPRGRAPCSRLRHTDLGQKPRDAEDGPAGRSAQGTGHHQRERSC